MISINHRLFSFAVRNASPLSPQPSALSPQPLSSKEKRTQDDLSFYSNHDNDTTQQTQQLLQLRQQQQLWWNQSQSVRRQPQTSQTKLASFRVGRPPNRPHCWLKSWHTSSSHSFNSWGFHNVSHSNNELHLTCTLHPFLSPSHHTTFQSNRSFFAHTQRMQVGLYYLRAARGASRQGRQGRQAIIILK